MLTVLLATRNRHKVRELRLLLKGSPLRFIPAGVFGDLPSVRESGSTFRANAVQKAVQTSRRTPLPVLAEDSGLKVKALGGRPGVRSARYAGPAQDGRANVEKLLRELRAVPVSRRQARFVCVMAFAVRGRLIRTFEGACGGSLALRPAGRTGFGYDPVFIPHGHHKTMSQLGARVKNGLSHRRQAALRFGAWLKKDLSISPAG